MPGSKLTHTIIVSYGRKNIIVLRGKCDRTMADDLTAYLEMDFKVVVKKYKPRIR